MHARIPAGIAAAISLLVGPALAAQTLMTDKDGSCRMTLPPGWRPTFTRYVAKGPERSTATLANMVTSGDWRRDKEVMTENYPSANVVQDDANLLVIELPMTSAGEYQLLVFAAPVVAHSVYCWASFDGAANDGHARHFDTFMRIASTIAPAK
jgi:hypothetical protein